jgi:hypothetical protein
MTRLLREGAPLLALCVVAIVVLLGILVVAARSQESGVRGFAEIRALDEGCTLVPERSLNALECTYVSPDLYEITFARDLSGSAPVASRSTCCPGLISVGLMESRTVLLALHGQRTYPVVAQIVVP